MRKNLKQFRVIELGLTMKQMAQKIGCSRATYSMVESGKRSGDSKTFWGQLQLAFDVPDEKMWNLQKLDT